VASGVYEHNFPDTLVYQGDLGELFEATHGQGLSKRDRALAAESGDCSLLVAGPPCQGHSDLNNKTRRNDPKNRLYLTVARAAEVFQPDVIVIENVPPVQWDTGNVVDETQNFLEKLGYVTDGAVINAADLGVPQRRKRFILIASLVDEVDPASIFDDLLRPNSSPRTVGWAIGDLEGLDAKVPFDIPSKFSEENRERIDILFDQELFDLPNEHRPRCHREKDHSYKSVYGRLSWDKPAQTITTGFTSMGQGRYVHPSQRRTLTPHEAARIQTFPDYFQWPECRRTDHSRLIGNAVPPLLMKRILQPIVPLL
jgi:DNA (cytosine-5)-methyltransferase 1